MRTDDRDALRTPDGSFLVALVAFVLIAATGLMLFLTAFVLWMYALTGSLIRPHLCRMQEQIETVYEVARAARCGYEWVLGKVASLLRPSERSHET